MALKVGSPAKKHVVVVGAGMAGLSCAFKLKESQLFKDGLMAITVLEAGRRAGGIVETIFEHGCLLESGPDSFITNRPYMIELAERLGIRASIIGTEPDKRGAMVVSKGRLVKLPEGFSLLAPTKILPFLQSPIMSWPGKMRVLLEPFLPVRSAGGDESLADFVRRRFGQELLTKIAQPMVGGIYVGDVEKLSASMTLERYVALEQKTGSVLGGLMRQAGNLNSTTGSNTSGASVNTANSAVSNTTGHTVNNITSNVPDDAQDNTQCGVRYGLFCTFDRGMSFVVDTLMQKLDGVEIRLSTAVLALDLDFGSEAASDSDCASDLATAEAEDSNRESKWRVKLAIGEIMADQVVLAVPARRAARLLARSAPALAGALTQIEAASSVVVNLVVDKKDISVQLDAFGVVVPEVEMKRLGLNVIALSFASNKFRDRAPQDKMVLRAFLGGSKNSSILDKSDEELISLVLKDLRKLLGYSAAAKPKYSRVCRWPQSMPQFHVGHADLLAKIDQALGLLPGLALAGASYRGVGLPECIHSGELCAEKILKTFTVSQLLV